MHSKALQIVGSHLIFSVFHANSIREWNANIYRCVPVRNTHTINNIGIFSNSMRRLKLICQKLADKFNNEWNMIFGSIVFYHFLRTKWMLWHILHFIHFPLAFCDAAMLKMTPLCLCFVVFQQKNIWSLQRPDSLIKAICLYERCTCVPKNSAMCAE